MNTLLYSEKIADKVANIIWSTNSYQYKDQGESELFKWKHDLKAPCYCECRNLNNYPKESKKITDCFSKIIKKTYRGNFFVIGMSTAGIPWATRIAESLKIPVSYTRLQIKSYGNNSILENKPEGIMNAIIIDDSCVSGKSIADIIETIHSRTDVKIIGILTITNWNFKAMRNTLEAFNIPVQSLTGYKNILEQGVKNFSLDAINYQKLYDFYDANSK